MGIFLKKFMIVFIVFCFIINQFYYIAFAEIFNNTKNIDKEIISNSLWSETNKPEFYGTTKIVLKKGSLFSLKDARYRIFARDFEDFNISDKIVATHNIDVDTVGEYKIDYYVIDSHNNRLDITVPVTVTDDPNVQPMIERTFYSLPSVKNISDMGIHRGNNHDRQMLGLFIEKDSNISIRRVSGDENLNFTMINNDQKLESKKIVDTNWQDVQFSNSYTPFIQTLYSQSSPIKVEIKWDEADTGVKELNYYHYGDNEEQFFEKWENDINSYAFVEGEALGVLVPFHDREKISNYYAKGFPTLDKFLEYYKKVVDKADEMIGLEYNPKDSIDQNVKTKFFVKANVNGVGAAYYDTDHVGVNSSSVASFFEANWGGLHELAHGYQGYFGDKGIGLGEVSNNVFGYYIQNNPDIYTFSDRWLGNLEDIEDGYNKIRLDGGTFEDLNVEGRLYFIINFLESFEGEKTYGKLAKIYRRAIRQGKVLNTQDGWIIGLNETYGVSIVNYLNEWEIPIEQSTIDYIKNTDFEDSFSAKDTVVDQSILDRMKDDKIIKYNYNIVKNSDLKKYDIGAKLKLKLNIDDFEILKDRYLYLINGSNDVLKIKITSDTIDFDLPIGIYNIELPNLYQKYYVEDKYVIISNGKTNITDIDFRKSADKFRFENDVKVQFNGYYFPDGAEVNLDSRLEGGIEKLYLKLRYRGTTLYNWALPADYKYAKIQVLDNDGKEVYNRSVGGNSEMFTTVDLEIIDVPVEIGYTLNLQYKDAPSYLKFISQLNGDNRDYYKIHNNDQQSYVITQTGLKLKDGSNDAYHDEISQKSRHYMDNFSNNVSEADILNKRKYKKQKSIIANEYSKYSDYDKEVYKDLYEKIINGNKPTLIFEDLLIIKVTDNFDVNTLYEGVTAFDVEDGDISDDININWYVDATTPGDYPITYYIKDSDRNTISRERIIRVKAVPSGMNSIPTIHAEDSAIKVGDIFDPLKDVKAEDKEDGDITDKLVVVSNDVDTTTRGDYKVLYSVTDSQGATTAKEIKVKVQFIEQPELIISVTSISINEGETVDLFSFIDKAFDKNDGDILNRVKISILSKERKNIVDISSLSAGVYDIVYSLENSLGIISEYIVELNINKKVIDDKEDDIVSGNNNNKNPSTGDSKYFSIILLISLGYLGVFIFRKRA